MLFRTLHIATLRKYQLLSEYLNMDDTIVVRNTQTIKLLNDPSINYSVLAMKLTLARRPMHFIFTFLFILIFISTYLIRATEVIRPIFLSIRVLSHSVCLTLELKFYKLSSCCNKCQLCNVLVTCSCRHLHGKVQTGGELPIEHMDRNRNVYRIDKIVKSSSCTRFNPVIYQDH